MIVLDASAALDLLLGREPQRSWVELHVAAPLSAPHLIDLEVSNALRRRVARRQLTDARARIALDAFATVRLRRYPHTRLLDRIWELRSALTAYDAAYVALAEALDAPLVTTDAALGRVRGHRARIEAFSA